MTKAGTPHSAVLYGEGPALEIVNSSVVVAGAATVIGYALCTGLAMHGARLGLIDLDRERGLQLAISFGGITSCTFRQGDLSVAGEASAVVRSLAAALDGIDAFVMVSPEGVIWEWAAAEAAQHPRVQTRAVKVLSTSEVPQWSTWKTIHHAAGELLHELQRS
jgi:NAD(P)-dependent dehydrogenase (short-subunit alcohol dehydrogenase family)